MSDMTLTITLTDAGLAAVAAAHGQGLAAKITHVAVGDAGYAPDASATTLVNELARVELSAGGAVAPRQVLLQGTIPPGETEFFIRELGYFLEDGTLLGVWSDPEAPLGWVGGVTPWFFKLSFAWSSLPADAITVIIADDAATAGMALDLAQLDGKVRHTIEVGGGLVWDGEDDTLLTDAIAAMIYGAQSKAQTRPQFDNTVAVATTAFVQRALGNVRAVVGLASNATLTAAYVGFLVNLSNATAFTVSLPLTADVAVGSMVHFYNSSGGTVTVAPQAADQLQAFSYVGGIPVGPGEWLSVVFMAGNTWSAISGSAMLKHAAGFAFSNVLYGAGYQRLPSGLIMQWGVLNTGADGRGYATFPVVFPSFLFHVYALINSSTPANYCATFDGASLSTSGVRFGATNGSGTPITCDMRYLALGA